MSFNGSGTFVINSAGQPVVSGTVISSTAFNALTADLANGLSTCITKDGQTTPTADIPMGSNKITGLANGTAAGDAANLGQVQSTVAKLLGSVSGADTITAVGSPTVAAYAAGQMFYFVAAGANTGAVTINIDSLGAKNITRDGTTALAAGDIQSGEVCVIVYDGTQFQLVNGASQSASIVTENLTVNKATVLNESGGDNDTRIEGDTDANLFFVDASADSVGIGTSSPAGKLHVAGQARIQDSASASNYILIGSGANAPRGGNSVMAQTGSMVMGTEAASNLIFITNAAESARFDSSGNLGLGVTPSAWGGSGVKAFDVGTAAAFSGSGSDAGMIANAYYNGSNWIYKTSSLAVRYQQIIGTGVHAWYTAPSGTAGNAISFTQAMTLDASNNLCVGSTSPGNAGTINVSVGNPGTTIGGLQLWSTTGGTHYVQFGDSASGGDPYRGAVGYSHASDAMLFFTSGAERARITSGGDLLLNTTAYTDGCLVAVRNGNNNTIYAISDANNTTESYFRGYSTSSSATTVLIYSNGNLVNTNGSYGTISDAKMKTEIVDAGSQWADMKAVRFRKFKMKDDPAGLVQLGVVAQELEQTSPGLIEENVDRDVDGNDLGTTTKSVKTSVLLMKAAVALQEAMTRIEELESKVAALEAA